MTAPADHLPGYPVTADSPPVGARVLIWDDEDDEWQHVTRKPDYFADSERHCYYPKRWAWPPGASALDRLLARPEFKGLEPPNLAGLWIAITHGPDSPYAAHTGPTPEAAALAALRALGEK